MRDINIRAFLKEAYVMKHFHHENVLELLGVCVEDDTNPLVLLPFMPHGDLLKYLHDDNNVSFYACFIYSVVIFNVFWFFGTVVVNPFIWKHSFALPKLEGAKDVTYSIISHEQIKPNRVCCFQSSDVAFTKDIFSDLFVKHLNLYSQMSFCVLSLF